MYWDNGRNERAALVRYSFAFMVHCIPISKDPIAVQQSPCALNREYIGDISWRRDRTNPGGRVYPQARLTLRQGMRVIDETEG